MIDPLKEAQSSLSESKWKMSIGCLMSEILIIVSSIWKYAYTVIKLMCDIIVGIIHERNGTHETDLLINTSSGQMAAHAFT